MCNWRNGSSNWFPVQLRPSASFASSRAMKFRSGRADMDGPGNNGGSIQELSCGLREASRWLLPRLFSTATDNASKSARLPRSGGRTELNPLVQPTISASRLAATFRVRRASDFGTMMFPSRFWKRLANRFLARPTRVREQLGRGLSGATPKAHFRPELSPPSESRADQVIAFCRTIDRP